MKLEDEMVNARFLRAIREANPGIGDFAARAILAAVAPLIRAEERERCARKMESWPLRTILRKDAATVIRAMREEG